MPRRKLPRSSPGSGEVAIPPGAEPGGHQRPAPRGSLRSKFFASGIILLLTVLTTLMLFLPFLNYELDLQIEQQEAFNRENIRQEAETIARLLVFELSRLDELWGILYEPADGESSDTVIPLVRTYLWEKVTFNTIIRDIELLDDFGAVHLVPFGSEPPAEGGEGEQPDIFDYAGITTRAFVAGDEVDYVFMPLYIEGNRWGVVKIAVSTEEIRRQLQRQAAEQDRFRWLTGIFFIGTMALSSLVGVLVLNLLARRITGPLKLLARNAEIFAEGGDTSRLERIDAEDDEVGLLAHSFASMAGDINRLLREKDEAYVQLEASQEQLRQSEKLATLGQLSGGIAHEINNALSPIRLRAEEVMLTLGEGGSADSEDLQVILKGIEQCSVIVGKLRDFASPRLGERLLIDLNEVIGETVALVRRQIEKRNIRIELRLGELPPISASPLELQQVFMNLMLNAKDAVEARGAGGGTITIATAVGEGAVTAEVADDGVGMDHETQRRIFEPFFTTKQVGRGTGLGMSVSFGILQSHGAQIKVESAPGKGTAVLVRFPLPPAPTAPSESPDGEVEGG